ncbi:zonular occludens toxin domain-containing protein [Vibrio maritimus]|uniref:zonular occludens toxin domain-containing protein n=1 Tax=Vibrio maritimus TaxID=990268 RepID=UPI001F28A5E0|nr:zonular occludens toxin domain-containing protein [Vibrio maritimus]
MPINIIVGRPGSGKSYESVVYHIIPALKEGRKVITNVPLNLDHFESVFGKEILDLIEVREDSYSREVGAVKAFSTKDCFTSDEWKNDEGVGALFVIDECHFVLPSQGRGKKASENLADVLEYMSMHRHYGHDILLMTQSLGKLHKDVRAMIQIQYRVSKHSAAGSDKTYTQKVLDGAEGRPAELNTNVRTYKPRFFPFYTSHTQSDQSVNEAHASDIKPIWKRWYFWVGIPAIIIALPMSITSGLALFGNKSEPEPVVESKRVVVEDKQNSEPEKKRPSSRQRKADTVHPFGKLQLAITGSSDSFYKDDRGRLHRQTEVYFKAVNKSRYEFPLKLQDLYMAGYDVAVMGPCLVELKFEGYSDFVYCEGERPTGQHPNIDLASSFSSAFGGD